MPQETTELQLSEHYEIDHSSPAPGGDCADRVEPITPVVTAPPRPGRMSWSIAPI